MRVRLSTITVVLLVPLSLRIIVVIDDPDHTRWNDITLANDYHFRFCREITAAIVLSE